MRNNSLVIDPMHSLIKFPHLTMQLKIASSETRAKPQNVFIDNDPTIPPRTRKTITAFVDHPSEWNTTVSVTPLQKIMEAASLLFSHSRSTILNKKVAIRVTNTAESPYSIRKNTQIAEISVVTPEQSKFITPVDMGILSMISECHLDLTAYSNELLGTN